MAFVSFDRPEVRLGLGVAVGRLGGLVRGGGVGGGLAGVCAAKDGVWDAKR